MASNAVSYVDEHDESHISVEDVIRGGEEEGPDYGAGPAHLPAAERIDLQPVHCVLVLQARQLQAQILAALRDIHRTRLKLAQEMGQTAESLGAIGQVQMPKGFPAECQEPGDRLGMVLTTLGYIHGYKDKAVGALTRQSEVLKNYSDVRDEGCAAVAAAAAADQTDFNLASDRLDHSFQQMRQELDVIGAAAKSLQSCDSTTPRFQARRFSTETCAEIDGLQKDYVLEKMSELHVRSCSLQSRRPVKSLGHTLDLQEIMLLAKNAKSYVYEVTLAMLKMIDRVKGEAINKTALYHQLTRDNSELLRRYCLYLKLKIQQL